MLATRFFSRRSLLLNARNLSSYPKYVVVDMPALSPTMTSGTISAWNKKVGEQCNPGDSIAEIETDKASMAFEAQDEFIIAKHLVAAGVEVPCGSPILITVEDAAHVSAFANYVHEAATPAVAAPVPVVAPVATPPVAKADIASVAVPAPVASKPIPVVESPTPPPVLSPTPAPVSVASTVGYVSIKWSSGSAKTALSKKLAADQNSYIQKYGRTGHKA